ncbi:DNA helicase RecQ [uncultured Dubosiella sp.]|uniref:DNA helicase RecQ n=2 Tax=uncultured Dubosiella sp. TaxID=1937011 RepID=UPI00259687D1|nr:DNA helicase RecQ [uncultured Dubosiella sp.]
MKYDVLKKQFGYDTFRPGQEEIIDAILAGQDTLAIMPTGAGKSLRYQIPALMLPGITLVVSPLISLMKDQVRSLNQNGIRAAYLNSTLTPGQYAKALALAQRGEYKIIYVAPERLESASFLRFVDQADISMVAIDEAHCVSQWGQNFRPSYLRIKSFFETHSKRWRFCAFTATATAQVERDMIELLGMRDPQVVKTGYDRKNLFFAVEYPANSFSRLLELVRQRFSQSGIIYCIRRKDVEMLCEKLQQAGVPATRYHAGLSDEERNANQEDFIFDRKPVMVATNAFGMGIDKPDVRYVIHYSMPSSLENYYQEAGRAGRDGQAAECILFYHAKDERVLRFFIENQDFDGVDEAEKKERIAKDWRRFEAMKSYALCPDCLRHAILAYFGEPSPIRCEACSNCLHEYETVEISESVHTILGAIKSVRQKFGATLVLSLVKGSRSQKIEQYHLDQSAFYGNLSGFTMRQLQDILRFMVQDGLVETTSDTYRLLKITPKGNVFFKQPASLTMRQYKKAEAAQAAADDVFEGLRAIRTRLSKKYRVPPYAIFNDRTLREMASARPQNKAEMLAISGVGEVKYKKFGRYFVAFFQNES